MFKLLLTLFCSLTMMVSLGQRIKVSDNQRFLVKEDGTPFFWLADTAWELFHRCDRNEVDLYLETRASQGFNVIQAVALAEIDGLNDPNPYGETPLFDNDPTRPNSKYFEHVDYVIDKADELGIYIALLPTWGDKLDKRNWGVGPEVFNTQNAKVFGKWIGERYKSRDNIIWVIGGDRNPRDGTDQTEVWRELAAGVAEAHKGNENVLMTFHPQPHQPGGSSTWFHQDEWLDFNMHQTGHCPKLTYQNIRHDYNLTPVKPVLDGEPLYEDHPICFKPEQFGHSVPELIRPLMYWSVFAGAFGQTYGCHDVWQMFTQKRDGINKPLRPWPEALDLPMANQAKHLKNLMLSRPFLTRIPDQSLIVMEQEEDDQYIIGTRDSKGTYAMVYFPAGQKTNLNLSSLKGKKLTGWWYDPRTGAAFEADALQKSTSVTVTPPASGQGNDWVLVVDAEDFGAPGK